MARKPIVLSWEPTPKVEEIRLALTEALHNLPQPLREVDVIAGLFFVMLSSLMDATIDEQTQIANTPLLEVAGDVFEQCGCQHTVVNSGSDPERKH